MMYFLIYSLFIVKFANPLNQDDSLQEGGTKVTKNCVGLLCGGHWPHFMNLTETFYELDKNNDGKLSLNEAKLILYAVDLSTISKEDFIRRFHQMDKSNDSMLELEEFTPRANRVKRIVLCPGRGRFCDYYSSSINATEIFHELDKNIDNKLSINEARLLLHGSSCDNDLVNKFHVMDKNNDSMLELTEFESQSNSSKRVKRKQVLQLTCRNGPSERDIYDMCLGFASSTNSTEVFHELDRNSDNKLSIDEARVLLHGSPCDNDLVKKFHRMDKNNNTMLELTEFSSDQQ